MCCLRLPVAEGAGAAGAPHVTLRRLTPAEALDRSEQLTEVYRRALGDHAEPAEHWASTVRTCLEGYAGATVLAATLPRAAVTSPSRAVTTPVGSAAVAEVGSPDPDDGIVGFLCGFDLQLQHWWPREIRDALDSRGLVDWLDDAFELMDLQVDPRVQGQGIGTRLLLRQFSEMPHRRMLLSTDPDGRARSLYRRLGFVDLVPDFVYEGTTYAAALMGWDRHGGDEDLLRR